MTVGQETSIMLELERAARAFGAADTKLDAECDDNCEPCRYVVQPGLHCGLLDRHHDAWNVLTDVCRRLVIDRPRVGG